jgi:hypothetical protein
LDQLVLQWVWLKRCALLSTLTPTTLVTKVRLRLKLIFNLESLEKNTSLKYLSKRTSFRRMPQERMARRRRTKPTETWLLLWRHTLKKWQEWRRTSTWEKDSSTKERTKSCYMKRQIKNTTSVKMKLRTTLSRWLRPFANLMSRISLSNWTPTNLTTLMLLWLVTSPSVFPWPKLRTSLTCGPSFKTNMMQRSTAWKELRKVVKMHPSKTKPRLTLSWKWTQSKPTCISRTSCSSRLERTSRIFSWPSSSTRLCDCRYGPAPC